MRRLPAAALSLACLATLGLVVLARPTEAASSNRVAHTCSATDRQFIQITQFVMTDLGSWSQDMNDGQTTPAEIVGRTRNEADRVAQTAPTDPSLAQTKLLIAAMLLQYGKAVQAELHHRRNAGILMGRAWGLANSAHDTLSDAQQPLSDKGCDIGPLL
jgi:hypothetical protein